MRHSMKTLSEKEIDTIEIEEEDWVDYIKRSTAEALDKMERAKIRCWNRIHKKMKWKLAFRICKKYISSYRKSQ